MGVEGGSNNNEHVELHTDGDQAEQMGPGLFDTQKIPNQKLEDIGDNSATNGGIDTMGELFKAREAEAAELPEMEETDLKKALEDAGV